MCKIKTISWLLVFATALLSLTACHQSHDRSTFYSYVQPKQLSDGLPVDAMYNVGMDTGKIVILTQQILTDTFPNIHSLLILRHGKLVYENYFAGEDNVEGEASPRYVNHTIDDLHECRSISKSFTSACIGIAIKQGFIKSIDEPIFSYFKGYEKYFDSAKRKITIRHLLTMTSGLEWDEKISYFNPENTEIKMDASNEPISFILSRKLTSTPGTLWNYSAASAMLLAEILKKATGERLDKFAEKNLFAPLGISKYAWSNMPHKENLIAAAWGLKLRSRDLAKFGQLYLNDGKWDNKQVLDSQWVRHSLNAEVYRPSENAEIIPGYGFQFWTDPMVLYKSKTDLNKYKEDIPYASGYGGQNIFFWRSMDMLIVFTSGNYNRTGKWKTSNDAFGYIVSTMKEMQPYFK